jgi:nicotinamidase-related amidase
MVRGLDEGESAALVVSECQRGVLDPEHAIFTGLAEQCAERRTLEKIRTLANEFRAEGLPVVHIHVAHWTGFKGFARKNPVSGLVAKQARMLDGTPQVDPMPLVLPQGGDIVSLRHSGIGMWYGTDLDATLRNMQIQTVVFVGVSTNMAIVLGAAGAADRGYAPIVVEDCIAGATAESHEWMIENMLPMLAAITSSEAVVRSMRGSSQTSESLVRPGSGSGL